MPRKSPPVKATKSRPNGKGRIVLTRPAFTLSWKNWKPKPWSNFVVFLRDPTKRMRSFHVGFNGARLNACPQTTRLMADEPDVYQQVLDHLLTHRERFYKPRKSTRKPWDDD